LTIGKDGPVVSVQTIVDHGLSKVLKDIYLVGLLVENVRELEHVTLFQVVDDSVALVMGHGYLYHLLTGGDIDIDLAVLPEKIVKIKGSYLFEGLIRANASIWAFTIVVDS
jgi:hypothetical protein